MHALLLLASVALTPSARTDYKVVRVDETRAFAGRLGSRVEAKLVLESKGHQIRVSVSPYHTIPSHNYRFRVGQMLKIRTTDGGRISLSDL